MLRFAALALLLPATAMAVHPSLGDRRTPPSEGPTILSGESLTIWNQALEEVLAQTTTPASNSLQAPPVQSPDGMPLHEIHWNQIEKFRIPGPGNRASEVLMVLDGSTADEAQMMLDTVMEVHDEQEAEGLPEGERLKARFVLANRGDLNRLALTAEQYEKYVVIEPYYSTHDIWMQDWGEIASVKMAGSDQEETCIFDSRRGRGLGDYSKALARQWSGRWIEGPSAWGTKGNYGGNIETTPDDVMVIGDAATNSLIESFRGAGYQDRLVVLESDWLRVGHIDEYLSFLPVPDSEAGYVIVKADATRAMQIIRDQEDEAWTESLRGMVHAAFQFYQRFPGVVSGSKYGVREEFEELVALRAALTNQRDADPLVLDRGRSLVSENETAAAIVDENIAKLQAELKQINGGIDVPVLSFPGLFVDDGAYRALLPGVSNLVILKGRILIPDPLVPQMREEIRQGVEALGLSPRFIPNLTYHYMNGEIHCGSITRRNPQGFVAERYARAANFRSLD